jgi:hypothetical protein
MKIKQESPDDEMPKWGSISVRVLVWLGMIFLAGFSLVFLGAKNVHVIWQMSG